MSKKALEIDMIAGTQIRDSQGEMLSVEGADISELEAGRGRLNDNHGKGFFNSIGRVIEAKKIFQESDCITDRHKYYWDKVKSPYIYVKGELYDDSDHPNARAAAAIMRNIHKQDIPLKMKASVEGGVVARGLRDTSLLARTKIHSIAITFTPANTATLVEPLSLNKGNYNEQEDMELMKSVAHLAVSNVPSFRYMQRTASAERIRNNFLRIQEIADEMGLSKRLPDIIPEELVQQALENKIVNNVQKIQELVKALCAGFGGAGMPTSLSGGGVIQTESLDTGRKKKNVKKTEIQYITCDHCGRDQVHTRHQVKCRHCLKSFSLDKLAKLFHDD